MAYRLDSYIKVRDARGAFRVNLRKAKARNRKCMLYHTGGVRDQCGSCVYIGDSRASDIAMEAFR